MNGSGAQTRTNHMAEIIKMGQYDPNHPAETALHFGGKGEDAPVLALLEKGADPNVAGRYGLTALHHAAHFDRQALVRALLDAGADPNRTGKWGATPLMRAKSGEVVRQLLEAGADMNAVTVPGRHGNSVGRTVLMYEAAQGNSEVVAVLLEYGADTHPRDARGCNALMLAISNEKTEVVRLLLDAGANVGLVEAALLGNQAEVQTLLVAGVDLNRQEMNTALRWAAIGGHAEVVELLLDNGTALDAADENGKTALMQAALYGRIGVMRLLLERGASPDTVNRNGGTALMESVQSSTRRNRDAVELLLAHGARADIRTRSGWTPLMLACLWGDTEVVALLLENGADPNVFTDAEIMAREGCSTTNALMLAAGNGHIESVTRLLQYGADPLAANNAGHSALDVARKGVQRGHKQTEIQQILPILEAAASSI